MRKNSCTDQGNKQECDAPRAPQGMEAEKFERHISTFVGKSSFFLQFKDSCDLHENNFSKNCLPEILI